VRRQWNARVQAFTDPKYGPDTAALVDDARHVIETCPRDHDAPLGLHDGARHALHAWQPHAPLEPRPVRRPAGRRQALRSYAALLRWYGLNVLGLAPRIIAEQLGHRDGGKLIVDTYGRPDAAVARRRIREGYSQRGNVRHLSAQPLVAGGNVTRPHTLRTRRPLNPRYSAELNDRPDSGEHIFA
jgi:hypothetical protein